MQETCRFIDGSRAVLSVVWNGTVLPLARKRLTAEDQAEIGRKMATGRGLDTPP